MTLIKSISGIRGTIGGEIHNALTPLDIVLYTSSYAMFIKNQNHQNNNIIIGRDARISGPMVSNIVSGTLIGCGFNVIDVGLSTTPTIEMAVILDKAAGGIIITASHNPKEWNALKLLNNKGEFLSEKNGNEVLSIAKNRKFIFDEIDYIGKYNFDDSYNKKHIEEILKLDLVKVNLIRNAKLKVVIDGVNSFGGVMVPELLEKLGVECIKLYCDPNGNFPHNPEPLAENLHDISKLVISKKADFGIVVDPDVDRLAIVCEDGSMFGEEYTLVSIADYVLAHEQGNTVSNLSSSRALKDIAKKHGRLYEASAVGEVNVIEMMKKNNAVIGGEGNGGIIYPSLHYGRDALVGIALFLSQIAERNISVKALKETLPSYFMSKNKIKLTPEINIEQILSSLKMRFQNEYSLTTLDGLKIDFDDGWVHLRKSNTEPIIRIYSEGISKSKSDFYSEMLIKEINSLIK